MKHRERRSNDITISTKKTVRKRTTQTERDERDEMVRLQEERLKDNKPTVIEPKPIKYEAFKGKEEDTRSLTEYGKFTKTGGSENYIKDYGG